MAGKHGDTRTIVVECGLGDDLIGLLTPIYAALEVSFLSCQFREAFESKVFPAIAEAETGYFASETDSDGNAWPPLSPATIARKGHDIILVETGRLRESLTNPAGGSDGIRDADDSFGVFGTSVPYAAFHQEGTANMPARPPVGVSEELLDKVCGIIADSVVEQIRGF